MSDAVKADSLVTLHYRLSSGDGIELVSTFDHSPATLQMGNGELAPPLEACVVGLPIGVRRTFSLSPTQAFGAPNPQLVQRVPRGELPDQARIEPGAVLEFAASGMKRTGCIRQVEAEWVLVDFNHPLAGKTLQFEVEIIGIL